MAKYRVSVYESPHVYDVEAKDESEAEAKILRTAGYELFPPFQRFVHNSSDIDKIEVEKIND